MLVYGTINPGPNTLFPSLHLSFVLQARRSLGAETDPGARLAGHLCLPAVQMGRCPAGIGALVTSFSSKSRQMPLSVQLQ